MSDMNIYAKQRGFTCQHDATNPDDMHRIISDPNQSKSLFKDNIQIEVECVRNLSKDRKDIPNKQFVLDDFSGVVARFTPISGFGVA